MSIRFVFTDTTRGATQAFDELDLLEEDDDDDDLDFLKDDGIAEKKE